MENLNPEATRRALTPLPVYEGYRRIPSGATTVIRNTTGGYSLYDSTLTSRDTLYPLITHLARKPGRMGKMWKGYLNKLDWGSGNFYVDRMSRQARFSSVTVDHTSLAQIKTFYSGQIGVGLSDTGMRTLLTQGLPFPSKQEIIDSLFGYGGDAIARTNPLKSQNQILVSITELYREGLPKLFGVSLFRDVRMGKPGNAAGSEFLNYQFGTVPLVSDIMSLCETVIKIDKLLSEHARQANKHIRRRYSFPDVVSNDVTRTNTNVGPNPASTSLYSGTTTGRAVADRHFSQKTWFSGAFVYYSPTGDDLASILQRGVQQAQYILGLRVTPDTLWELAPWSWLIDWFTNIGDVLSNISYISSDGLVLQYGYVMQHTNVEADVVIASNPTPLGQVLPVMEHVSLDRKARLRALPYGFRLKAEEFSPKQWAILGALGLTRSPGRLF